jgi:hypothetical protein
MKATLRLSLLLVLAAELGCTDLAASRHASPSSDAGPYGGSYDLAYPSLPTITDDGGVPDPYDGGTVVVQDPTTCDQAAANRSYIGCDYWPTVVANVVWSVFDFAVVVSNPGMSDASVTLTGPGSTNKTVTVPAGQLVKIYLPWVSDLKGSDADAMGAAMPPTASMSSKKGAFHLVSTLPVLVYQFSALEYGPMGGPVGKDWSTCPGAGGATSPPCFSYSNDASLLLPSTAMTGNYRVFTEHGQDGSPAAPGFPPGCSGNSCLFPPSPAVPGMPGYIAITATQDGTTVKVKLSATGSILAGTGVSAVAAGGLATYSLDAGDVIELMSEGATKADLSGSMVQADKPVQVIAGSPCINNPVGGTDSMGNPLSCDHLEATVQPAETLGKHYVVTQPTGPQGNAVGQTVRFVGNVDGTQLTFNPAISGAPATLNAGQVVELGMVNQDFEVTGTHEFIVATIQLSGALVDPTGGTTQQGDPSLSTPIAVEQYRLSYVFLAPSDYQENYADVVAPTGAHLMLDGAAPTVTPTPIGSGFVVYRIKLSTGSMNGAHTLSADVPVGMQVEGYGSYTSYQYPAGLDLLTIAPPPPPIT